MNDESNIYNEFKAFEKFNISMNLQITETLKDGDLYMQKIFFSIF